MRFDYFKFKQIVLYIINNINKKRLGNVKLNKILWFADLEKCKDSNYGYSITGETYIRQSYGPVAKHLPHILKELEKYDKAITIERETPDSMILYTPVKKADVSKFQDDIKYIDDVIDRFKKMKARDISELTHTALWQSLSNGEEMPVEVEALEYYVDTKTKDEDISWKYDISDIG